MRNRRWLLLGKLALTVALLAWLGSRVELGALRDTVDKLPAVALLIAWALLVLQSLLSAWRWRRIVQRLGGTLPAANAVRWVFLGQFFNVALPTSVGGDAYRVWKLHQSGGAPGQAFASVAIERGTGLVMLGLMVSMALPWVQPRPPDGIAAALLLVGPALALALAGLCALSQLRLTWIPSAVSTRTATFGNQLRSLLARPVALAEIAGLGALASTVGLLAAWVLGTALGLSQGFGGHVALVGGALLLAVLPVSLGGWGLREAGMVALFGAVGEAAEPALALSLLWGLLPLAVSLPVGALLWLAGGDRLAETPAATGEQG